MIFIINGEAKVVIIFQIIVKLFYVIVKLLTKFASWVNI